MEDTIFPGMIFETRGENLKTPEGNMRGTVTLRIMNTHGFVWNAEIIGIEKPEWEWMLGKVMRFHHSFVREQFRFSQ
jgi:hypothetical protein